MIHEVMSNIGIIYLTGESFLTSRISCRTAQHLQQNYETDNLSEKYLCINSRLQLDEISLAAKRDAEDWFILLNFVLFLQGMPCWSVDQGADAQTWWEDMSQNTGEAIRAAREEELPWAADTVTAWILRGERLDNLSILQSKAEGQGGNV